MSEDERDFVAARFYNTDQIMALFAFKTKRQVWRAAGPHGFLAPHARRYQERYLLFDKAGVDRLIENGSAGRR